MANRKVNWKTNRKVNRNGKRDWLNGRRSGMAKGGG